MAEYDLEQTFSLVQRDKGGKSLADQMLIKI
jgi:hypothetical protein